MKLSRLGDYIESIEGRNKEGKLDVNDVRGISTKKVFIETKADMEGVSIFSYKTVAPTQFAYVADTSRRGDKISLAYNDSEQTYLVSSITTVFQIRQEKLAYISPTYLYMYLIRSEFDRYSRFNSWGSAREAFTWESMCEIELPVPPIDLQQKYVDVYKALVANQKAYESGLATLKFTCDASLENLRRNIPQKAIGPFISERNEKNNADNVQKVIGISINGVFDSFRTANKESLKGCKKVYTGDILYASQTTCGIGLGAVGQYTESTPAICAPTCTTFYTDEKTLLSTYLLAWMRRSEFWRYATYYGSGVVDKFDFNLMSEVQIPIPDISVQKSIVDIFRAYEKRKKLNKELKKIISSACPILIKGSIEETQRG